MKNRRIERAAGGIVVRMQAGRREVLLIEDAYGHVAFPKGHVEPGETWQQTAVREVAEETGIRARVMAPIGRVEYPIERGDIQVSKQVRLFLMQAEGDEAPVHQEQEIQGAYFLPWSEASQRCTERGYVNWSWALETANVLWQWYEGGWEQTWRQAQADLPDAVLDSMWQQVALLNVQLLEVADKELQSIAGPWYQGRGLAIEDVNWRTLPRDFPDISSYTTILLRQAVEHTLLKPEASALDVENLCEQARGQQFRTVCVNPMHAGTAAANLQNSPVIPCIVVGFPLGAHAPETLAAEATHGVANGARELDMVIPVGSMVEDDIWTVYEHIRAVCAVARANEGVTVKVILECHFLSPLQVAKASLVAIAAGADFIKTSTGFALGGARIADVALMTLAAGQRASVKAAGGIRTRAQARQFLRYGATRLGTSSGMSLVRE